MPVRLCRGSPQTGNKTAGSGMCPGRQTGLPDRTAGARCDETPPSASVRRRTVGQSPPPLRQIGQPGRSGSPGSDACRPPSYPPRSAISGVPEPLKWTSSDPGPAL